MDKYYSTSDERFIGGGTKTPPSVGFASCVLPEVQKPFWAENSHTGVSTISVLPQKRNKKATKPTDGTLHWHALRTTYGREKKAYDYFVAYNVIAFLTTLRSVKLIDGKRSIVEESRTPNIFFAYATKEELQSFVYDNVNLPYLRYIIARHSLAIDCQCAIGYTLKPD